MAQEQQVGHEMRILDLGCGEGLDLTAWKVTSTDQVIGLDLDGRALSVAKTRFPDRSYLRAAGENLPFEDESFTRVISTVALPYMNIQKTIAEIHRCLAPGGRLFLSLHPARFTLAELIYDALPKPIATLYRLYVLANGLLFHCTGKTIGFLRGKIESFQTERGMRIALKRAGFIDLSFRRPEALFLVEATKLSTSRMAAAFERAALLEHGPSCIHDLKRLRWRE